MKYYTIYKITNNINGKYYIGKHITENLNDGYMGSGKLIKKAIEKYGIKNFTKTILHNCKDEKEMNIIENLLINLDDKNIYNLQPGGIGGFSYINENNLGNINDLKNKKSLKMKKYWTEEKKNKKSLDMIEYYSVNGTEKISNGLKKRYSDKEYKKKFTSKMEEVNKDIEKRKKAGKSIKDKWDNDKDFQEKMKKRKKGSNSNTMKERWKDPEFRKMMLEKRKK